MTAALAVIAAVISIWPSLRILEIQEDATRPAPTPYFDMTSRYHLLQLRVKNTGAGVAYDIHLKWTTTHPQDEDGNEITALDSIDVLMPADSASVLMGRTNEIVRKYPNLRLEGTVDFKDAIGHRRSRPFLCSTEGNRTRLMHDEEMVKTLYDLQHIPEKLDKICKAIEGLHQ